MQEKFLVTDIETTTYVRNVGKIIEIGITEVDPITKKRNLIFNKMVNPGLTMEECEKAWCVTQGYMRAEEIFNAEPIEKWLPVVQSIIDAYSGITAFNSDFDFWFLEDAGIKIPFKLSCLMRASTDVCKLPPTEKMLLAGRLGHKPPNVQEAYDHFFGKDHGYVELHRGGDDSLHEAEIAIALNDRGLLKKIESNPVTEKTAAAPKPAAVKRENQAPIVAQKDTTEFIKEIDQIVHVNKMPAIIGENVKTKYIPFLQAVYQGAADCSVINFENPSAEDQELAREIRLKLVKNRTSTDKFKKEQKLEAALKNKLEDHCYGVVDTQSRLLEGKLSVVENFAEEQAKKKKAELELTRSELLKPYVTNPLDYPIGTMDEKQFNDFLKSQKLLHDANAKEAEEAAANELKRKETERLGTSRKEEMIPFWNFLNDDQKAIIWGILEQDQYDALLASVKALKTEADKKTADQAAELEKSKKQLLQTTSRTTKLKEIGFIFDGDRFTYTRFVGVPLIYDLAAVKDMADNEFNIAVDYAKSEMKKSKDSELATLEHKIKTFSRKLSRVGWVRQTPQYFIKSAGEGFTQHKLEITTLEKWNDNQLTQEIERVDALIVKEKLDKEQKAKKSEDKKMTKAPAKEILTKYVESIASPLEFKIVDPDALKLLEEINQKLAGFKKWANREIAKLK